MSSSAAREVEPNRLVLNIQPDEGISVSFGAKRPGTEMSIGNVTMNFSYQEGFGESTRSAYATLVNDCVRGDATLFDRADSVEAAWSLVDPILDVWSAARAPPFPNTPPAVGDPKNPTTYSNATAESGTTHSATFAVLTRFSILRRKALILAGDVGGTKCNLALFSEKEGKLTPVFRQRFRSKDFAQFDLIAKEFARQAATHLAGEKIEAAGFGIAGPVINNRVRATNLPWMIDAAVLSQELDVKHIVLLNDLGAWAIALSTSIRNNSVFSMRGTPSRAARARFSPRGTGLGESLLAWDGNRYRVIPSEGGHSDFAPHNEQQIELLRFMKRRYPQVSWELILSGRGFRTLHEFSFPYSQARRVR